MKIYISNKQNIKIDLKFLKDSALKILREIDELTGKDIELSILFVDDRKIKELNKKYLKVNSPTDVIAFPQDLSEKNISNSVPLLLGDVVISVESAKRQADYYNVSFEFELLNLLAHGILHLLGYEDTTSLKRKNMLRKQKEILKRAGFNEKGKENS